MMLSNSPSLRLTL